MPSKRANSIIEEEALLTRPSSPHQMGSPRNHSRSKADGYDIEYRERNFETESQSLLASTTSVDGQEARKGKGDIYGDGDGDDDEHGYLFEDAPATSMKSRRTSPSAAQRRRRRVICIAAVLAGIILGALLSRPLLYWDRPYTKFFDDPHAIMSNGTHNYQKTVLVVSIDGLRCVVSCSWWEHS